MTSAIILTRESLTVLFFGAIFSLSEKGEVVNFDPMKERLGNLCSDKEFQLFTVYCRIRFRIFIVLLISFYFHRLYEIWLLDL